MDFGTRLRKERERAGYETQEEFSKLVGISKKSQSRYENNQSEPGKAYFEKIDALGIDVEYLLFGRRSANRLTKDEEYLLSLFNKAPFSIKAAAVAVLESDGNEKKEHSRKVSHVGQYVEGDATNNIGGNFMNDIKEGN